MLIETAERFDMPVSTLLGETVEPPEKEDAVKAVSDRLALINEQLAKTAERKRRWVLGFSFAGIALVVGYLIWQIAVMIYLKELPFYAEAASNTVIGGADMPSSIFVSCSGINLTVIIIMAAVLSASICGICLVKRKASIARIAKAQFI